VSADWKVDLSADWYQPGWDFNRYEVTCVDRAGNRDAYTVLTRLGAPKAVALAVAARAEQRGLDGPPVFDVKCTSLGAAEWTTVAFNGVEQREVVIPVGDLWDIVEVH
jgi:hypothetical protein